MNGVSQGHRAPEAVASRLVTTDVYILNASSASSKQPLRQKCQEGLERQACSCPDSEGMVFPALGRALLKVGSSVDFWVCLWDFSASLKLFIYKSIALKKKKSLPVMTQRTYIHNFLCASLSWSNYWVLELNVAGH